jgi:hypothetical protein
MFNGVSTNGSSNILVQIGDSGGIETTGYSSAMCYAVNASASVGSSSTAGFLSAIVAAVTVTAGHVLITNVSGNAWVYSAFCGQTNTTTAGVAGGTKTLSDTLTQVRITTVNGTDTFDAGTINLMWE